jgi:hypothetical protein
LATTGLLVDAMHDARAYRTAYAGQAVAAMVQQGVDQGAGLGPRRGMDHHAGGLVDDDQIGILVDYGQRDVLRRRLDWQGRGDVQGEGFARLDFALRLRDGLARAASHGTGGDQLGDARARQAGDVARQQRQRLVQPLPGLRAGDGQFNRGFGGVSAIPVKKVHHGSAQS